MLRCSKKVQIIVCFTEPVKVTDMNTYSTSHYHLMNEHVVDKADTQEQVLV